MSDWKHIGSQFRYERFIEFAGRDWRITVIPGSFFIAANRSHWFWMILPLGALLSGVIGMFLNGSVTRRFTLEFQVRSRTRDLEGLNGRLKEYMAKPLTLQRRPHMPTWQKAGFWLPCPTRSAPP